MLYVGWAKLVREDGKMGRIKDFFTVQTLWVRKFSIKMRCQHLWAHSAWFQVHIISAGII